VTGRNFDGTSTADDVLAGLDLVGKLALVTGASSGLGAESARALAARGAAVVVTARDVGKAEKVAAGIRETTGNAGVSVMELHLEVPSSVRAFAKDFLARHRALHLLIGNAGVMACPLERTAEGYELQFATNHLGHYLLGTLLAPALRAGAPARVVSVSSAGHRFATVNVATRTSSAAPTTSGRATARARPRTSGTRSSSTGVSRRPACAPSRSIPA